MNQITSISVKYRNVDGWHIFTSDDVCGLYVASEEPERAYNDVSKSIQKLIKLNEGVDVKAELELSLREFLERSKQRHAPKKMPERPISLSTHRYLVQACAAA